MNLSYTNYKILISSIAYSSLIILISLMLSCSIEANYSSEKVKEKLITQKWIRDSYTSKNSNGDFENFNTKSELEFSSNGNLLIKDPKSIDSNGTGTLPPPHGLVDTLIIHGKWMYFENTNTLTLKADDSVLQKSNYNYINWKLSRIDDHYFEIENTEKIDAIEIIKVSFKSKF